MPRRIANEKAVPLDKLVKDFGPPSDVQRWLAHLNDGGTTEWDGTDPATGTEYFHATDVPLYFFIVRATNKIVVYSIGEAP